MNDKYYKYDVIIVGGGLAGSTAACTASSAGARTLLISINMDSIAAMQFGNYFTLEDIKGGLGYLKNKDSLIPSIIRNNILAEINGKEKGFEQLGGFWIIDRKRFSLQIKEMLESRRNLVTRQGLAAEVMDDENGYIVRTSESIEIRAKVVIICAGTFLDARIFWGENIIKAGRPGEIYSSRLYKNLVDRGLKLRKGKLFSAPRILQNSVNKKAENIKIYKGGKTDIYSVSGIGKSSPFKEAKRLYLLPEGLETEEMYIKGFENDLAEEDQVKTLSSLKGFEKIYMTRPGYRIEYGCLKTDEIGKDLEAKNTSGLFFAGRITGIDSYGKSILQGYVSGKNAVRTIEGKKPIGIEEK
jgi:tRNA uridine 5-carboxymethylaminomethyl modification enzyme